MSERVVSGQSGRLWRTTKRPPAGVGTPAMFGGRRPRSLEEHVIAVPIFAPHHLTDIAQTGDV